jgi:methyl-accepting chemotaxis protein
MNDVQQGFRDRRRIHFIKKGFQAALIVIFVAVAALSVMGAAVALDLQVREALRASMYRSHIPLESTGEVIFPRVVRVVAVVFAVFLLAVSALTLLVLNRVGREFRTLERAMARLGNGDLSASVDGARWIPDLARLFNDATAALRNRTARTIEGTRDCRKALDLLHAESAGEPPAPATRAMLRRAAAGLDLLD